MINFLINSIPVESLISSVSGLNAVPKIVILLDFKFPNYNPNPEDLTMLNDLAKSVKENNADVGFAFDGDGDRLGVVDNEGNEIFSDKIGLMLAEYLSENYSSSKFVIDVKSTGLFFNMRF